MPALFAHGASFARGRYGAVQGGRKVGLGLLLRTSEADGLTYVKETIRGFAAHAQGTVMPNDCIIAIDGRSVEGWDLDAIKQLTFGEEGTVCSITMRREYDNYTVSLTRILPAQHDLQ